jgi:hypothetical protein
LALWPFQDNVRTENGPYEDCSRAGTLLGINTFSAVRIPSTLLKPAVLLLLGASAVLNSRPSDAVMIINATETLTDVVFTYNGTVNITDLPVLEDTSIGQSELCPSCGYFLGIGTTTGRRNYTVYGDNIVNNIFPSFGGGGFPNASNSTGDVFGFGFGNLFVPVGYSSTLLSGSASFAGSFATLGMDTGTYTGTFSNGDTITLNVGTAAVPAPLPILGLPAVLFYSRKLKKRIKERNSTVVVG